MHPHLFAPNPPPPPPPPRSTFPQDSIGSINYDRPVDVAVIHHYKYLSSKEFRWKSCVRKTVDDKYKDCGNTQELSSAPYAGSVYDDSAWRLLKKNVPKYAAFDEFEDFM